MNFLSRRCERSVVQSVTRVVDRSFKCPLSATFQLSIHKPPADARFHKVFVDIVVPLSRAIWVRRID